MDFTVTVYRELLKALMAQRYAFQTTQEFLENPKEKVVLLRHDVDDRKLHSLEFAKIQAELGIVGTYYFRVVPESFDVQVIQEIATLGHEIGYHYEDMDFAKGNPDEAIRYFEKHLAKIRAVAPVNTICMHGSPKSKYDNKDVWKKYDYRKYDIIGEPYFDLDFNQVAYYTDTGRMWDGFKVSVRDKVKSSSQFPVYHTTQEMIEGINKGEFPKQVMMNFHPQRWTDSRWLWRKDALVQNVKNQVKKQIVKRQHD